MINLLPAYQAELVRKFLDILPGDMPVYLTGGAVRDVLIQRQGHDLDLALTGNVLQTARKLADAVGAAYYPLDSERDTARMILMPEGQPRLVIDVASLRGGTIEDDLRKRDFTVNAIAVDLRQPDVLIDPLNGAEDLLARRLRACSDRSLLDDPVRVIRAVRVAFSHQLKIMPETRQLMRQAVHRLPEVSVERVRDELFRILSGTFTTQAVRTLDLFGALEYILPELEALKDLSQSPPHTRNVWEHTLAVVDQLKTINSLLGPVHDPEQAGSLATGLVVLRLGRFRNQIDDHLKNSLSPERSIQALLSLAALYHDIAKPRSYQVEADGRIRFFEHDRIGAEMTAERARFLRLSSSEVERLKLIVRHHMRPMLLAQDRGLPSRRATYRFFRDSGIAGVDVCLLSTADFLGTYGVELPHEALEQHLDIVRELLETWWERSDKVVYPPRLLDGRQLMQRYNLAPGPQIGKILDAIQEAQASGDVTNLDEAFRLAGKIISGED